MEQQRAVRTLTPAEPARRTRQHIDRIVRDRGERAPDFVIGPESDRAVTRSVEHADRARVLGPPVDDRSVGSVHP